MTSSFDTVLSLAHVQGGVMITILALATVAGFVAGILFERSNQRSQDDEK